MARDRVIERDDTTIITFDDDVPEEITDQEAKSESLFDQLRSDPNSYINVMRQPLGGRNTMEFVARYEADQFDYGGMMAHIQKMYGGGEYRIMAYYQGKLKGNKLINIAHPLKLDTSTPDNSALNTVLQQMEKMQQQMAGLYLEKQTGGNTRKEMLEEMMLYKQLFDNGGQKQSGGIKELLDTVGALKDLGLDIGLGGAEKESGWSDLAEKFLPLATLALTPQNPQPVRQMKPNPQQRPVQPNPQPRNNEMNLAIKFGVAQLVAAARKNSDPYNYAALVLDNIDRELLMQFFMAPDLSALEKVNPEVAKYRDWFELLGEHIKAQLGLPSKVDDLYDDLEGDIVEETTSEPPTNDNVQPTTNS